MRICYSANGESIHTQRWVNYFASRGHEVHLISSRFTEKFSGYDTRVQMHPLVKLLPQLWRLSGYISGILWLFQIRRIVREIKPDIVDAHFIVVPGYLGVASGFHPLILTAWGSDILITPKQNPILKFITKKAIKRADCIICVSPVLKQELLMLGAAREKIHIIPMGVDVEEFSPKPKDLALLQALDISDSPVVISVRNLEAIYNVETLLRAAAQVLHEIPNTRFIIAGEGEQRKYLEGLANALNITGSVRFVGWIPHSDLSRYLVSSDVYVSTSLSDSLGVSNLEAMACRIPVIVGDLPATREWIVDGESGFIFPLKDQQALAEKIINLLRDNGLITRVGDAGRKVVVESAEYGKQMAKVEKIYQKLVGWDPN